jgi:hypothetical protein
MDEFENDMDEKLMVKLLTDVFKKLPPDSYLCVDILFDFVFKDIGITNDMSVRHFQVILRQKDLNTGVWNKIVIPNTNTTNYHLFLNKK